MLEDKLFKFQELEEKFLLLKEHMGLEEKRERLKNIEENVVKEDFWKDIEKSKSLLRERTTLIKFFEEWNKIVRHYEDVKTALELLKVEEDETLQKELDNNLKELEKLLKEMEIKRLFIQPEDVSSAILSINAGAGGTEAQDWAEMLLRMYLRWAEKMGYKAQIVDILAGDEAGIKNVTITVDGPYAYGYLKAEEGIHRLIRISPFDASGRRHTSFASVSVIPQVEDDIEIEIKEEDLKIDTYRASGCGGQKVNKTDSAVRITHLPTGIVVQCQNERSQHKNKEMAIKLLKAKLYELEMKKREEEKQKEYEQKKEIAWGSQIRTYVLHPYKQVKDHRTQLEVGNAEAVLDGEINDFIEKYLLLKTA
jgi:peptide chain release factor 2